MCEATIREVREEDLDQVIEINLISLKEHYPVQFWRDHLQLWGKIFLVAEVDSRIVGYVMTRIERGFSFLRRFLRKLGHVVSIAVHPNYRRRGIGSALMVEVLRRMKDLYNVDEAYLEVRVSNIPAIKLYEKLGFKIVKVIKHYYADGEDAYLMAREL
ncbi:MAG: ribosomal protein S18-alanine N-acetyltransferase [Desulfurococcales archaeon]|nr:ribosomal protein S18-alanine N-acetyltransferase [Desulfurococcales archaeon]